MLRDGDRICFLMPILALFSDLRYAARNLMSQRSWTATAILCLAIGTGANTAGLSVINTVLLRPLPFDEPDRIASVNLREANTLRERPFTLAEYRGIAGQETLFSDLAARTFLPGSLVANGEARMVNAELVSENYFRMLQVRPLAGQTFESANPADTPQAVISYKLWRGRFQANPDVIGQTVQLNSRDIVIAGIAPDGFVGATRLVGADIWVPASLYPALAAMERSKAENTPNFGVMGRLKRGAGFEQATQQLNSLVGATLTTRVEAATGFGFPGTLRTMLLGGSALLLGMVGLVMAVAIANVSGLMLARLPARRREIALRMALGAGTPRIARQVFAESVLLGLSGSAIGAILAAALTSFAPQLGAGLPEHLVYAVDIRPDWRVLLLAAITGFAVSVLFGLAPARFAMRTSLSEVLKATGVGQSGAAASGGLKALVIGQVAASTILLAGCGLLTRTYLSVRDVDPGSDASNVTVMALDLTQLGEAQPQQQRFFTASARSRRDDAGSRGGGARARDSVAAVVGKRPGIDGRRNGRRGNTSRLGGLLQDLPHRDAARAGLFTDRTGNTAARDRQ